MSSSHEMSANERIVRTHLETINRGELNKLHETASPKIVIHLRGATEVEGIDKYVDHYRQLQSTFSNMIDIPLDIRGAGDRVYVHALRTGALVRPMMGIQPEGQTISVEWMAAYRLEGGKVAERWCVSDDVLLLQQLGMFGGGPGGAHGHSHNGKPCHGHGAQGGAHGHSHGPKQMKLEDHAGPSPQHGHSHNGKPCHGHGGKQSKKQQQKQQQNQHSHSHSSSSTTTTSSTTPSSSSPTSSPAAVSPFPSSAEGFTLGFWNATVAAGQQGLEAAALRPHARRYPIVSGPLWQDQPFEVALSSGETVAVIARFQFGAELARQFALSAKTYQRDIEFLRDWAPKIAAAGSFQSPRVLFAGRHAESEDTLLVLDDLSWHTSVHAELSLAQARRVVQLTAAMHGAFWQEGETGGWAEHCRTYPWLITPPATQVVAARNFRATWPAFLEVCGAEDGLQVPAAVREIGELLATRLPLIYQLNFTAPLTVCHNDLNASAFYFADEGAEDPAAQAVFFSTWSEAGLGRGVRDVATFVIQSLPSEALLEQHDALLQLYHATLAERGVVSYSLENCRHDFMLFAALTLVSAVCNGTGLLRLHKSGKLRPDQEPILAHHKLILSRAFFALEKLDILAALKAFLIK